MTLPILFRPEVAGEIDEIHSWYEQRRPGLGDEFLAELRETLDRVAQTPELYGRVFRAVRCAMPRKFPYCIFYRVEPKCIRVFCVQRGGRAWSNWKDRV